MGNERIIIYTKTACNMFRKFEANFTKSTIGIKKKKRTVFSFALLLADLWRKYNPLVTVEI